MSRNLFRNVRGSSQDPVATWPYDGMVSVIEDGLLPDWRPLFLHLRDEPWGTIARYLEHYLSYAPEPEVRGLFQLMLDDARSRAEKTEKGEVATRIARHLEDSRMTSEAFARAIGTSPSRFSTYLSGKVIPSAALMVRMENVAAARSRDDKKPTVGPKSLS